ncbi:unnamed protein product [Timema podura]|uniref:LIM zinc-binding domain-containing protein n=1 Tax=Timema podura TaxID=61482 RepID=A0ABN7P5G6_TIMPD|nr:unnamed protein product [Timema podura]
MVYEAEKMISKNTVIYNLYKQQHKCRPQVNGGCVFDRYWHRRCFNCKDCHRSLDSTNLNDGPDRDIYCRSCYGRNFGPKGVGFGIGAGTLSMA